MVHFVGAGPGAPDLITQRGAALLQTATASSMPAALSTLHFWGSLKQIARSITAPK